MFRKRALPELLVVVVSVVAPNLVDRTQVGEADRRVQCGQRCGFFGKPSSGGWGARDPLEHSTQRGERVIRVRTEEPIQFCITQLKKVRELLLDLDEFDATLRNSLNLVKSV